MSNFCHPRPWLVVLILLSLSLGLGGRMKICLMPDGAAHLEEQHASCHLGDASGQPRSHDAEGDLVGRGSSCLDLPLEEGASHHQQRGLPQLPPPSLAPLALSLTLALTDTPLPPDPKPCIAPPLLALSTVVLLI